MSSEETLPAALYLEFYDKYLVSFGPSCSDAISLATLVRVALVDALKQAGVLRSPEPSDYRAAYNSSRAVPESSHCLVLRAPDAGLNLELSCTFLEILEDLRHADEFHGRPSKFDRFHSIHSARLVITGGGRPKDGSRRRPLVSLAIQGWIWDDKPRPPAKKGEPEPDPWWLESFRLETRPGPCHLARVMGILTTWATMDPDGPWLQGPDLAYYDASHAVPPVLSSPPQFLLPSPSPPTAGAAIVVPPEVCCLGGDCFNPFHIRMLPMGENRMENVPLTSNPTLSLLLPPLSSSSPPCAFSGPDLRSPRPAAGRRRGAESTPQGPTTRSSALHAPLATRQGPIRPSH